MTKLWMAGLAAASVAALIGCGDRNRTSGSAAAPSVDAAATETRTTAPQAPAAAGADAIPASCQIDPSFRAATPALPANAQRGDDADYQGLTAADETLPDGSHYDVVEIGARAGQRLRMTVTGQGFLPRLILYGPDRCPLAMTEAQSGAALMDERLETAGEYRVLITSRQPGQTGAYSGDVQLQTETPLM